MEKTVREAQNDTGKNDGSENIHDGFDHNATGSTGDVMEYQIISTLPTITSKATSLTTYNFYDSISEGLTYNKSRKDDATIFYPVTSGEQDGHVIVKGMEDDTYIITECETANGYTLLKDSIKVVIRSFEGEEQCDIYSKDTLGVLQNDPHYNFGGEDLELAGIPQKHLEHYLLTASATVDDNDVTMLEDGGSVNAIVPLTVVNTKGFDLPKTGDYGTWMFGAAGIALMAGAGFVIVLVSRKKRGQKQ